MSRKFKVGDIVKIKTEVRFGKFLFAKIGDRFRILEVHTDKGMLDYSGLNLENKGKSGS